MDEQGDWQIKSEVKFYSGWDCLKQELKIMRSNFREWLFRRTVDCTIYSRDHFYKMHRFIFFRRFIITVDIYPSETNVGVMIAYTMFQKRLFKL